MKKVGCCTHVMFNIFDCLFEYLQPEKYIETVKKTKKGDIDYYL